MFSKSDFCSWPSNKKPKMTICEMNVIYANLKFADRLKSIDDYRELVNLSEKENIEVREKLIEEFIALVAILQLQINSNKKKIDKNIRLKSLEQKQNEMELKYINLSKELKQIYSSQLTSEKSTLHTTKLKLETPIQFQSSITKSYENKITSLEEKMAKLKEKDFLEIIKRNEELIKTNEKLNSQINEYRELEKKLNELHRKSEEDLKNEKVKFSIIEKKNKDLLKNLYDKKQTEIIQPTDCTPPSISSSSSSSIPSSPLSNNFDILSIDPTISQPHQNIEKKLQSILPPQPILPSFTVYLTDNSLLENMNEVFQQSLNNCVVEKLPPQPINFKKNSLILFVKNISGSRADVDVDLETMQNLIVTYGVVKDSITDQYPIIYTAFIFGRSSNNVIPNSIFKSVLINYGSRSSFNKNTNKTAIQTIQSFIKIDQNK
ncbi:hypothetical protein ACTFIV_008260 [Dictyostelium citrinum]